MVRAAVVRQLRSRGKHESIAVAAWFIHTLHCAYTKHSLHAHRHYNTSVEKQWEVMSRTRSHLARTVTSSATSFTTSAPSPPFRTIK